MTPKRAINFGVLLQEQSMQLIQLQKKRPAMDMDDDPKWTMTNHGVFWFTNDCLIVHSEKRHPRAMYNMGG